MALRTGRSGHARQKPLPVGLSEALCGAVQVQLTDTLNGTSQRDHLEQVCRQTGKTLDELGLSVPEDDEDSPDIPEGGEFLWSVFWELSQGRGNNGFTENPLSWLEIAAFSQLSGHNLTPFEAETLRRMDAAYLATRAKMSAKK